MPSTKPRNLVAILLAVVFGFLTIAAPRFASSSERVLRNFCYGSTCGSGGNTPYAGVIFDAAGNLYGTTTVGDDGRSGVVYELIPNHGQWTAKTLLALEGEYGFVCQSSLILDAAGNLYGATSYGGAFNSGVVFELIPNNGKWQAKVLHSFNPNQKDGVNPYGSLTLDGAGNLYGTTYNGGTRNSGTVFELMRNNGKWTHRVLHNFGGKNGANPQSGVTLDAAGNLYGTTYYGGTDGTGTVFELSLDNGKWMEKVLYSFKLNGRDALYPAAGLIFDMAGNLYGTTEGGGFHGGGTVFELMRNHSQWTEKVLHGFNENSKDGAYPLAGLVMDKHENLYGTTYYGGTYGAGTVFELILDKGEWAEKRLYSFCPMTYCYDGALPMAGVIFDKAGNLYGTTENGGLSAGGTVFEVTP
jgi:uncharacterized repeat protein (TIGR03803 family)